MEIDPGDRIGGPVEPSNRRGTMWIVAAGALVVLLGVGVAVGWNTPPVSTLVNAVTGGSSGSTEASKAAFSDVYAHLGIDALPDSLAGSAKINPSLSTLKREKCDSVAIIEFAKQLEANAYRRAAATGLVNFSNKCSTNEKALMMAYGLFAKINDADEMIETADKLVELKDFASLYYYWRGLGFMKKEDHARALDDFVTTVGLQIQLGRVRSQVFVNQSNMYEKLGRYCEAMTPIQVWVAVDPASRDTPQTRNIIAKLAEKGDCDNRYAKGSARFPIASQKGILVKVDMNGTKGTFVLDTGASSVSVSKKFADRAKLTSVETGKVALQTANGITYGHRAVAQKLSVGGAEAENVAVVVLGGKTLPFGRNIDGLLGMSFLARFELKIGNGAWSISPKKSRIN